MAVLIFKQGNYTETGSLAYAEPIFFTDANTLIISGGVSTYTNTEVTPSISAGRVGYRVATIDSINTGSFLVSGDVSASNLFLDGNATVRGNITMGGSGLDFGDASDDNVVFKADISSSFIPNNDDSFDLGSNSQRWKTAYLSNLDLSGSLYVIGGPIDLHSDTYISASSGTFTHLDVGSYLDVDVTGNTTFDGQGTLSVSSSGALKIDSPTSISIGTNSDAPIDIDSTTLDIDSSGDITIDTDNAKIAIAAGTTASLDGEEGIHIGLEERVPVRIEGNSVTINGSANVDIDADGGKLTLDGSTGIDIGVETNVPIDLHATTLDIDASGALTIDSSATTLVSTGSIYLNSRASTLALSSSGDISVDSETSISIGTEQDVPIDVDSSTLDIDASGAITISGSGVFDVNAAGALTLDSDTSISIGTDKDKPIDIDASTLDIDASGAITIDGTSTLSIDVDGATNINTSVGGIEINSEAGSLTLDGHTGVDIDASNSGKVTIDGAGGIDIGVAADVAIDVDSSTFDLDASGNITLDSATGINVGTVNSGVPISIGHTTSETTINDNLTVTGNFTVNGTTTYVSSSNVTIGDRIIELNYLGATGNGGIYVGDADGTTTSGSLLWDSSNDYWIAGAKDVEHKILLSNGDSIISGSGTNNQITTFTGTHGVDSSANLTFDGSILRVTGTQEITSNLSGSASASFADLKISDDASIASLTVTDLTNDRVVIVGGGGEIEDSANLTFDGSTLGVTGNVTATASGSFLNVNATEFLTSAQATIGNVLISGSVIQAPGGSPLIVNDTLSLNSNNITNVQSITATASGSFKDVKVTDNVTVDGVVRAERLNVTSSENILATFESTDAAAKIVLKDVNGEGARFSYLGSTDTVGIGQSNTHNEMSIHINDNERVAIGSNHTIPHAVLDVSGSLIVSGTQEIKFGDLTVHETGSFGRVVGSIGATNGVISGSSQVNIQLTQNYERPAIVSNGITASLGSGIESSEILTLLDGHGIVSGSSQISGLGFVTASDATKHPNWIASNLVAGTNVTISSGSDTLTINSSGGGGGGGVGTLQQVTDSGSNTTNDIGVGAGTDSTSKTTGALVVSGGMGVLNTINAGGDVIAFASSDERLKDNIKPIENPLEVISQISGNTFDWNSEKQNIYNGKDYGVIAQEIQKVMPELVDTRDNGYLAVKYDKIVPLLIESIKELKKEIEELKSK
tara:strand:- start:518 stop:4141 length:3624 start_codon:yes stop_codon:yes gene_type:complete